jgi:hypothetical protein
VTLRALMLCALAVTCLGNARADDATPVEASAETRARIAVALEHAGSPWAATVREADTTLTRVTTPPWLGGSVWRVERFLPTRPLVFYVADGKGGPALLTGKPTAFNAWVRADRVEMRRAEQAETLARLFVETTRDTGMRLKIVDSADALPFRPGLNDAQATARDHARAELATMIRPPHATARGRGWEVLAFAVAGMDVAKLKLSVARDGTVELHSEKLRADLPLVYAN